MAADFHNDIAETVEAAPMAAAVSIAVVSGELRQYHPVTLSFSGPTLSESSADNPFLNYRLLVNFSGPSGQQLIVPGYFAADGNAANTSATGGNQWRAHLVPNEPGAWSYVASFRKGSQVGISLSATAGTPTAFDGAAGTITIGTSDKTGADFRSKGMLRYVGERYLRHDNGDYFLKGGAGSPENLLGYYEFDATTDLGGAANSLQGGLHHYNSHLADWKTGDPTWQNGEGKRIIGLFNYLASEGMNSVYFLTYNIDGGDGREVHPWTSTTDKRHFDVSKLAQWEAVFSHADTKGILLHLFLQETENDQKLNNGNLGLERKLYYREMVARFGHHLGLQWNLGEENSNTTSQQKAHAQWLRDLDPYDHPIAVHTHPSTRETTYNALLGSPLIQSASMQIPTQTTSVHSETIKWIDRSKAAGVPWVVSVDENGPATTGVKPDANDPNHDQIRKDVLWANLMAGGAGPQYYFGYDYPQDDLDLEDMRTRDKMWDQTRVALQFFRTYLPFQSMRSADSLTSNTGDYVFRDDATTFAVYLKNGGTTNINLAGIAGTFSVQWFNPRAGGALQSGSVATIQGSGTRAIGSPPADTAKDWVALIRLVETPAPAKTIEANAGLWQFELWATGQPAYDRAATLLQKDYVAGLIATVPWSAISTGPGQFDRAPIDRLIDLARANGKKIGLRIDSGPALSKTPAWLADAFAGVSYHNATWNSDNKLPYINDPNWFNPLLATHQWLVDTYDSEPVVTRFYLTLLGGEMYWSDNATVYDELLTLHGKTQFQAEQDLLAAWATVFAVYENCETPLSIPISNPWGYMQSLVDRSNLLRSQIVDLAANWFGVDRLALENDGASQATAAAGTAAAGSILDQMYRLSGEGFRLGFESLPPSWITDAATMLTRLDTYDPLYVQLWPDLFGTLGDPVLSDFAGGLA